MRVFLLAVVLALYSVNCFSATESSFDTKVERIFAYTEFGNGDVGFWLTENEGKECYGYWMSPISKGFDANFSLLLSAYHANSNVIVYGKLGDDNRWPGSTSGHYCKVDVIILKK
ncbi:hypothetical protein [Oleiphilus sp. HI0123]|uniref:hypothetical protein n=1 Tax=Oleiphilus sp. HI0123 TaxID=1822265 RepID=UPI0007C248CC|nr:hypothetical protein [Oleiphilus sp. HI0123]KZY41287.1 hypothetical protein A3732_18420 [Oleiphilus sp. HI0050]KZZ34321.1 hypothetical protein A3757_17990 [Oleiphilus sp. HI0117]KZZ53291.1 hypothetical protein A3761_17530 [Oleiphilus sp. HI0123]